MSLRDIQGKPKVRGEYWKSKKSDKSDKLKINKKLIIYTILGLVVIYIIFMVFSILPSLLSPGLSEEDILKIAENAPITQDFISKNPDYRTNITFLTTQDLISLSKKYPAIYGDLTDEGVYSVEYSSDSNAEGILLLIDKNKNILKYYRVRSMSLAM